MNAPVPPTIKREGSRVQSTVTFAEPEVRAAEERALDVLGRNIEIKGFRLGKAPRDMIRTRIGAEDLLDAMIRELLRTTLPSLIEGNGLRPIVQPKVEVVTREPLTLKIVIIEHPEVTVKGMEKLSVPKKAIKIDPKEVEKILRSVLSDFKTLKTVERAAAKGDQITIDFTATDEHKQPVAGMSAQGYAVTIGEANLLPGFEEELIGLSAGKEKTFGLKLPDTHPAEAIKGKAVTFAVKAVKVEEAELPELNDEFAKKNLHAASAEEFRKRVEDSLRGQEEQAQHMERERELLDLIRDHTKVDLAPELIDEETRALIGEWQEQLEKRGQTPAQWLEREKKTAEQADKEFRKNAEDRLKLRFGIQKIIEERKIIVTDSEMTETVTQALRGVDPSRQEEAKKMLVPGTEDYAALRWRRTVEKALGEILK